ncbi:MAG: zinc-binding dehydrogenase, partial [Pseudonocardia sp.]|nr:zinc-binding dehydrogenase [Pseudonocardia sp.]
MKAAVVHALGRPPIYAEVEEPRPVDGQVVAQVRAAAVKNIERSLVAGTHYGSSRMRLPGLVGLDAVVSLPDGRRAYAGAAPPGGSMAERVAVDPARVVALPDGVDESAAAALPNAAVSAWFALEYAGGLRPGGAVLVLGGTGVTGSLAVQLAKRVFGAGRVVVAGRDPARLERLTGWGADAVIRIGGADGIEDAVRREHHRRPFDVVV